MKKIGEIFISFTCVVLTMCTPPDNPFQDTGNVNLHIEVLKKPDDFKYCINDRVRFKVTVLFSHLVKKISIHFGENADKEEQEITTNESKKEIFFDYVYKEKGKKNVEFTIQFRQGEERDTTFKIDIGVKPEIKNLIVGDNRKPGKSLTITVDHVKFSTARYEWYKNSKILPGQDQQSLIFNPLKKSDEGRYHCIVFTDWGKDQSKPFDLSVKNKTDVPKIQDHPRSIQITAGNNARFIIKAEGTNLRYQWFRDGDTIENAIQASLETGPVSKEDDGKKYHCIVSNDEGEEVSTKAILTVIMISKPRILEHPGDTTVIVGTTVMFSVNAEGKNLIYQWLKNGEKIKGAAEQSYIVKEAKLTDNSKKFSCIVSNSTGKVNSNEAILTVKEIPRPKIVEQPKNQEVTVGEVARFLVVAKGGDLNFRWQKNQKDIPGATEPEYIYKSVIKGDNGAEFRCIVTNNYGSDTSKTAILSIKANNPPIWKQELVEVETKEGIKVSVDLLKYFDKDPDGDQVTFVKKSGPGTIGSNGKVWSWIPNFNSSSPTPAECVITAKDNGNPGMSGNMTISVTVIDSVCKLNLLVASGKGKITADPSGTDFNPGTDVKIIAVPEKDYVFKSWSGDIGNADTTNSSIQITMDANKNVSAIFVKTAETIVLNIGESYVHGLKYIKGYYFASTRTSPAKLLRFNANDLSDYSEITFSTGHNEADDLVYAEKTGKIYVVFADDTDLRIAEVDPYTMEYDENKIVDMSGLTYNGKTITTDNEFLYVGARYPNKKYESKLIKYSLSTLSNIPVKELFLENKYYGIHSVRYQNNYLYIACVNPAWILKVNASTLTIEQVAVIDGLTPTEDFALTKDYLFVGLETYYTHKKSGVIYRISTNDISKMYPIETGVKGGKGQGDGYCYAVQYCIGYVWALFSSSPGVLTRIDPVSLEFKNFQLEINSPNEISSDGRRLFITYWNQNPGRVQAIDPSYLNGREIP